MNIYLIAAILLIIVSISDQQRTQLNHINRDPRRTNQNMIGTRQQAITATANLAGQTNPQIALMQKKLMNSFNIYTDKVGNYSFANSMIQRMKSQPIEILPLPQQTLRCEYSNQPVVISQKISYRSLKIDSAGFYPTKVCVYNYRNECITKDYLSVSTDINFVCSFEMKNMIITEKGVLLEGDSNKPISFSHSSMVGNHPRQYAPIMSYMFLKGLDIAVQKHFESKPDNYQRAPLVIPIRTRYDDCFNHQSFQSIPLISLIFHFYSYEFVLKANWQASKYTAALLLLLKIPLEKIIIEKPVMANQVKLVWIPQWNPIQLPAIFNISHEVNRLMTEQLLSFPFIERDYIIHHVNDYKNIVFDVHSQPLLFHTNVTKPFQNLSISSMANYGSLNEIINNDTYRYIVYLSRSIPKPANSRTVENENELLLALDSSINKEKYRVIVLGSILPYKEIHQMHLGWQIFAKIIHRAKVIIGPHGGSMNNLMFAPDDCELIEFNELPKEDYYTESHNQVPIRVPFLAGWWAKGGRKYWNIEASMKNSFNFYEDKMKINLRELFEILLLIDKNNHKNGNHLLHSNFNISQYSFEKHSCYSSPPWTPYSHCG